ncbi:conserved hypothetical protein [Trichinella spiralis]|uniref:hypothetical protein n=1 Tax=Trichinella spiralis TaxID=6334 RepID=UPI0001EFDA6D|nr:conserved hypothetical protein [Trichinella spiralis]
MSDSHTLSPPEDFYRSDAKGHHREHPHSRQRLTEQSVEVVQPAAVVEENGAVEESGGQEKSVAREISLCRRLLLTRVHVAGRLLLTLSTSLVGDRVGRAPSKRKALRSMSEDGSGEGGDPRKRCSVMVGMSGAQATLAFALASALEDLSNGAQKRKHTSSEMFIEGEEVRIVVGYSGQHPGRRSVEQHAD